MLLQRWHRLLWHTALGFAILTGLVVLRHIVKRDHYLSQDVMFFDHQSHTQNPISSSKIDAKTLCKASNFSPYQGERRVYD